MKIRSVLLWGVLLPAAVLCAQQKAKKHSGLSAVFENARYVYVAAIEGGDITQPNLYPPDRQAIADVQDGLHAWNRYALCLTRQQADLVFLVRKGRAVSLEGRVRIPGGQPSTGAQGPGRQPGQTPDDRDAVGAGAEVGPSDDLLEVFFPNPDGKLTGPIWMRELKDGLEGPNVLLLEQLREAVEHAYPSQPPATKP